MIYRYLYLTFVFKWVLHYISSQVPSEGQCGGRLPHLFDNISY